MKESGSCEFANSGINEMNGLVKATVLKLPPGANPSTLWRVDLRKLAFQSKQN